jgi:metallo-beta-lactamase class B
MDTGTKGPFSRFAARVVDAALLSRWAIFALLAVGAAPAAGASGSAKLCPGCAQWNQPHKPFRIYGNTYYVGTQGLSAILITSDFGHVLIDGGLRESAPGIAANVEALGFKISDIKAILNSHTHYDHAGGIAELQRLSGANVYALRPANEVLTSGKLTRDDPQYGEPAPAIPPVARVWVVQDAQLLGVGGSRLRAVASPGHTPGGTSWTWESCEGSKCLNVVYADSLSAVAAEKYRFGDHPDVLQNFERTFARLDALPCDVLLTPHPNASQLFERLEQRPAARPEVVTDDAGCKRYVQGAREALARRLQDEGRK